MRVGSGENKVALELGVNDLLVQTSSAPLLLPFEALARRTYLADDVLVGEADDEPVLGRVVLVLGLGHEPLARVVVGLTLCSEGSAGGPKGGGS